mmetsp:Transcript_77161/g.221763  ORF Transcript_77161/g.221763 Transcript_77161/m.221763 type:complete len:138 (+) Transcript_77161:160-573(+)
MTLFGTPTHMSMMRRIALRMLCGLAVISSLGSLPLATANDYDVNFLSTAMSEGRCIVESETNPLFDVQTSFTHDIMQYNISNQTSYENMRERFYSQIRTYDMMMVYAAFFDGYFEGVFQNGTFDTPAYDPDGSSVAL